MGGAGCKDEAGDTSVGWKARSERFRLALLTTLVTNWKDSAMRFSAFEWRILEYCKAILALPVCKLTEREYKISRVARIASDGLMGSSLGIMTSRDCAISLIASKADLLGCP